MPVLDVYSYSFDVLSQSFVAEFPFSWTDITIELNLQLLEVGGDVHAVPEKCEVVMKSNQLLHVH